MHPVAITRCLLTRWDNNAVYFLRGFQGTEPETPPGETVRANENGRLAIEISREGGLAPENALHARRPRGAPQTFRMGARDARIRIDSSGHETEAYTLMHTAPEMTSPADGPSSRPPRRESLLLSRAETAAALGLGQRFTDELIYQGTLPSIRLGRRVLVRRDVLEQFIRTRRAVVRKRAKGAA